MIYFGQIVSVQTVRPQPLADSEIFFAGCDDRKHFMVASLSFCILCFSVPACITDLAAERSCLESVSYNAQHYVCKPETFKAFRLLTKAVENLVNDLF